MKINWKVRFKNKTWMIAFLSAVVGFVYQMLGLFGIAAPISEDMVIQMLSAVINAMAIVGVVVDPTTNGLSDSKRAMGYTEPRKDE